jgi:hypothetical protein
MRKLTQTQKEKIIKDYGRLGYIIIMNTEKYGKETEKLENDIDNAYDIMLQQAE